LRIAKWEVIPSTFLQIAKAGRIAEGYSVALGVELISADLESVGAYAAVLAMGLGAGLDRCEPA
jgi:hypothetical protein